MRVNSTKVPDWYETTVQTCLLNDGVYTKWGLDRWFSFAITEGFRLMNLLRHNIFGDLSQISFVVELFDGEVEY